MCDDSCPGKIQKGAIRVTEGIVGEVVGRANGKSETMVRLKAVDVRKWLEIRAMTHRVVKLQRIAGGNDGGKRQAQSRSGQSKEHRVRRGSGGVDCFR